MTTSEEPPVLEYRAPMPADRPSFLVAVVFGLPGAACWAAFLAELLGGVNLKIEYAAWFGYLWLIAMLTATASLLYYALFWRDLKAWYVIVCLCINVPGLLFSIFIFARLVFP